MTSFDRKETMHSLRENGKLSLEEIGNLFGVTKQRVFSILKSKSQPSMTPHVRFCALCGTKDSLRNVTIDKVHSKKILLCEDCRKKLSKSKK